MKKLLILTFVLIAGIFAPVFADTMNYTIRQVDNEMVIVPYGSELPIMQKSIYNIEVYPTKMPFYSGKNYRAERTKSVLLKVPYTYFACRFGFPVAASCLSCRSFAGIDHKS